jgi:1-acyl-sn-glycerol-3-phosphate acyltransferase
MTLSPPHTFFANLRRFPREPDALCDVCQSVAAGAMRAYLKLYHRFTITGREHLPRGSFVLVSNHTSHLDALCLMSALPWRALHHTFPAAAADYFFVGGARTALAVLCGNALPFHRRSRIRQSLAVCRRLLGTPGNVLILFPEGTRSPDGRLAAFKPGIGLVLAGSSVPVVPCYIDGAHRAWARGHRLPRPGRLRLVIGEPRVYDRLQPGPASAHAIAAELHCAVAELGRRARAEAADIGYAGDRQPVFV